MFVTWYKTQFRIHDSKTGNIMFIKALAEDITDAQLSGNQLIVSTKKRTEVYRRIGNTFAFSFYRSFEH